MELYILDSLMRRVDIVDRFNSLIWTERFAAAGDFELIVNSTIQDRGRLTKGTWLAMNLSHRVMRIEQVEDAVDQDGQKILTVKGPSFEDVLNHRAALAALTDLTVNPKWTLTGTPGDIMRKVFHDICVTGTLDPADVIPFIDEGSSLFPSDNIAEPTDVVTLDIDPKSVYSVENDIAAMYDLGFRLVRDPDVSRLYFDVFSGVNRTTDQDDVASVVFSPELDNLEKPTELSSISTNKNVAYVVSPAGHAVVYAVGADPTTPGFERRVLLVVASDITAENTADVEAALAQRGQQELAKNRSYSAFDGELNQSSTAYRYGVDYNLGDLVEMRNTDGATNQMRVTEQIFVQDKEGERSYPTLAMNIFIEPGTWGAWDFNEEWADLGPEDWAEE